jgi:type I restriction enzyme, R subunit
MAFLETEVELAALEWLKSLGYAVVTGPDIAPGEAAAERTDYGEVLLAGRVKAGLKRLNPGLPAEAIEDAFRKVLRLEGAVAEARNRAFHRMLVDGVPVEYRAEDGSIRGVQACLVDFANPDSNDFLAINQFTVIENKHNRRPDIVLFINGIPFAILELKNAADENATIWSGVSAMSDVQGRSADAVRLQRIADRIGWHERALAETQRAAELQRVKKVAVPAALYEGGVRSGGVRATGAWVSSGIRRARARA